MAMPSTAANVALPGTTLCDRLSAENEVGCLWRGSGQRGCAAAAGAAPGRAAARTGLGLRRTSRSFSAQTCYNLIVTSPLAQPGSTPPVRFRWRDNRIPPIFTLGVILMVIAIAFVSARALASGGGPQGRSETITTNSGTPQVATVASPPVSPSLSPGPSQTGSADPTSAPSPTIVPPAKLTGYIWPLNNAKVTLPFGPTTWGEDFVNGQRFHDGLDMATYCGDTVYAAHDGTVLAASRQYDLFMGWVGDITPYLNLVERKHWWDSLPIVIVIDDGNGYRSIYAHEVSVTVKPGQQVKAGQVIGYEGATGMASGCHVHYGLFNPLETATFQSDPGVVKRDLIPTAEIARVNPLLVLPFRCEVSEMRTLWPDEARLCPPPTPMPPKATPKPATHSAAPTATPTAKPES
jgi:murein DD-endopeptidase MepM/ murein hydrolase activator NlpD